MTAASNRAVEYFDSIAGEYADMAVRSPSYGERFALYRRLISVHGGEAAGARAIDLGCGSGTLTRYLAAQGFDTVGIDGSEHMLTVARKAAADTVGGGRLAFRLAELPVPETVLLELEDTARVLVASSVIEFIDSDREFLRQCARMLRPTGVALVSFANSAAIYRRLEQRLKNTAYMRDTVVGIQRRQYTEVTARVLALEAGLTTIDIHYYTLPAHRYLHRLVRGRPPWLATLFLLVLRRNDGE